MMMETSPESPDNPGRYTGGGEGKGLRRRETQGHLSFLFYLKYVEVASISSDVSGHVATYNLKMVA